MNTSYPLTGRNQIRQARQRGNYEHLAILDVLRESPLCHVGFALDGQPFVLPMVFGVLGQQLYLHGGLHSRLMQVLAKGVEVCVSATLLDGFVMARSAFHHSMNYRSVVLFGSAQLVTEETEKQQALVAITDHGFPGRSKETRAADSSELKATQVVRFTISEASLKQRQGGPADNPQDLQSNCWAGVIPLTLQAGQPIAANDLEERIPLSQSIAEKLKIAQNW